MTKGEMMKTVYTEKELRNIDSAIPMEMWKDVRVRVCVMNYNDSIFGNLENMLEVAKERKIEFNF